MDATPDIYDVICIGAGLSGLTAASTILKAKPSIRLCILEAKDRVGGRTHTQTLKCCDRDGNQTEHRWEMGGMWVGTCQRDIMQLLDELSIGTYKQYTNGRKCLQLDSDDNVKTYSSDLPSVGVFGTLDLGQTMLRVERLIKTIDPSNPYSHPDAVLLDSMTVGIFLRKYSWTEKIKDMLLAAVRTIFGADSDQISALYFLTYCSSSGSLRNVLESTDGTSQELKIEGGSQNVCNMLIEKFIGWDKVKLSSPVMQICQKDDSVAIVCLNEKTYTAHHVITAIPPHQHLRISYTPPLPSSKRDLFKHMPVGHLIKAIITYQKPYWRLAGFSGEVVTTDPLPGKDYSGALSIVYDATSEEGHPALVAFIGGSQATFWADKTDEERKKVVVESLSKFFGDKALLEPIDYREKNWAQEPYNGGCPVNFLTPGIMKFYQTGLQDPLNRLEFAGTETSPVYCGFLSGAVFSGRRAAENVLSKFSK